jgi:predicted aconitase with swiveling domain
MESSVLHAARVFAEQNKISLTEALAVMDVVNGLVIDTRLQVLNEYLHGRVLIAPPSTN